MIASGALALAACGDDGGGESAFCDDYRELSQQFNVSEIRERADEFEAAMREIDPPEEIADDWNVIIENADLLGMSGSDLREEVGDDPSQVEELQGKMQEVSAATERVDDYWRDSCG